MPDLYDYLSNNIVLSVDGIKHVFPRKRYEELLYNLHCAVNASANPAGQPSHGKIRKVVNISKEIFRQTGLHISKTA